MSAHTVSEPSKAVQRLTWGLALAGLVPFLVATLILFVWPDTMQRGFAALALATYGAVILSFLGGARWGAALEKPNPGPTMVLSILPPLLGWFALAFPLPLPFVVQAVGFALHGFWDWRAGTTGALPVWFVRLRSALSVLVFASLTLAAVATLYGAP